jgi:hypothetical protein
LLIGENPGWSPMAVKSALMTTASQTDNAGKPIVGPDGVSNATPLNFGSGHVTPAAAFDPGLVYDSGLADWVRYGCGINQMQLVFAPSVCNSFGSINASNLNYPTLAVGSLAGTQTLTGLAADSGTVVGLMVRTPTSTRAAAGVAKVTVNVPAAQDLLGLAELVGVGRIDERPAGLGEPLEDRPGPVGFGAVFPVGAEAPGPQGVFGTRNPVVRPKVRYRISHLR